MSNTERKRVLNYRNDNGSAPNPVNIDYGEIAIGYKKDNEAIYIKNTANEIVDFTPISIVNITYNELKELRDNSKLKPSQHYRITDFVTTVTNDPEARSAGHPFDIIVLASEKNKLQEECYAIQHEGDEYFANCNLAAWKIWYCLDNDNTKYAWVDTVNGKGVIYRMIDEWQNDCPYDFKNVQFKRYWANGINITKNEGEPKNIILQGYYGTASNTNIFTEGIDTNDSLFCFTFTRLNNVLADYEKGSVTQSNVLDESIQTEGLDIDANDNKINNPTAYNFHNRCRNNILKPTEVGLLVDTKEYMALVLLNNVFITVKVVDEYGMYESYQPPFDNTLGASCYNNTFGNNCGINTFGNVCADNTFGNDCYNNTFGNICYSNSFGNGCHDNTFGNSCNSNSFGNYCGNNTFGNGCGDNTFGNVCGINTFGNNCADNSFGDSCDSNSFGNDCIRNSFGIICYNNTFGDGCADNTLGVSCYRNSFGNSCWNNSFGNDCWYNQFGNYCESNSFGKYFMYNALGNHIQYIEIPTEKIYHTQILNGTQGTQFNKLTIEFTPETQYSQFAGLTSDGVLKIWVEADAPISTVNITYNELKELRDNSKLKPSQYYRITDFVTTVANDPEAQSAGHQFDIIVMASKKNKLQEECYAIQHEGVTYFDNCNLAAWKIWYCLDNDTTKYAWADTTYGKGVIYRMIDEWQNDCPYDFKNVQFKRYAVADASSNGALADLDGTYVGYNGDMTGLAIADQNNFVWVYTFSFGDRTTTPNDASIIGYNKYELGEGYGSKGYYGDNTIKPTSMVMTVDSSTSSVFCLNNIVWWTNNTLQRGAINGNRIESECFNMTLSGHGTIIEHDCCNFIMGSQCYGNSFKTGCSCNSFGNGCQSNSFGNGCYNNTFGNDCIRNSFGNGCNSNSFGNGCHNNTFGNGCADNTFGNDCYHNSFGNGCQSNSFGNVCADNTFGNDCHSNSFGDGCHSNSFGNGCHDNTFGNGCHDNTFGNICHSNSFGNDCYNNSFGNICANNSFGNNFQYNALGNDVQYVEITTEKIYHTQILNGTQGTSSKKLTIEFTPETGYSQFAGLTSDGVLATWVESDAPHDVVDGGSY